MSFNDILLTRQENGNGPVAGEAPTDKGNVELKAAALDAFRVCKNQCLDSSCLLIF